MVKLHTLMIEPESLTAKMAGKKPFEIRKNDRNFEAGDIVRYIPEGIVDYEDAIMIECRLYQIVCITDYEQKDGYIVFGEREL